MDQPGDKDNGSTRPSLKATGPADPREDQLPTDLGSASTLAATLTPGTLVAGRYRIANLVGRGGMGEVYRAEDLMLGIPVALKFLPGGLNRSKRRLDLFRVEVRHARRVSHPNVCRVHDIGESGGQLFLSMELVEGEDLTSLLRRIGRLPYEKAMEIARQLCSGLSALHDQGLVHRDLKPANVMIDARGRAKIADFGLAVLDDQSQGAEVVGTLAYMSPEQLHGRAATARSDIYALGLLLYELFTGVRVHDAGTPEELRRMVDSGGKPGRPSAHLERSEQGLDEAISRCLEADPIDRPSSALGVLALLPGGDPLRAVLEAEQTPSPDLVAACGPKIPLAPWAAALLLAGALACLPVETVIKHVHGLHHAVDLEKSPEVLVDRAKTILRTLGYTEPPMDHLTICGFRHKESQQALKATMPNARLGTRAADTMLRDLLARTHPAPFGVTYIESSSYILSPENLAAGDQSPIGNSNSVAIVVSQGGDLLSLRAIAPRRFAGLHAGPPILDRELLILAGLDPVVFRPGTADFVLPGVSTDNRTAWVGSYPGLPNYAIRAEIARLNGRVVAFEVRHEIPSQAAGAGSGPSVPVLPGAVSFSASQTVYASAFLLITAGALILAYRQWRSGRGDVRGAGRLAAAVFAFSMLKWLLRTHHAPLPWWELGPFQKGVGEAAAQALIAFALYLTAEPILRKRAPTLMVSWSRMLAGRWRDSAVGRDVLIGLCFTSLYKISELAWKTDWTDPIRLGSGLRTIPSAKTMASVAYTVGQIAWATTESIVEASITLLGAVVIIKLCRWRPLGIAVSTLAMAAGSRAFFGQGDGLNANLASACFAVLAMFAALRFGLLALVVSFTAAYILNASPATLDLSDWFFPSFAANVLVIAATAVAGFRLAMRAPPLASRIRFRELL